MQIAAKKIIGLRVETKSGQYLGRVRDLEIDADTLEIKKFYVRPAGLVKGLTDGDLVVGKNSVVLIDEEKLVVEDLAETELVEAAERKKQLVVEGSPISASVRK
jgi:sporulation protein YlmC with PRC-barrel domain